VVTAGLAGPERALAGWGRAVASRSRVTGPLDTEGLCELVAGQPAGGLLARGAGLSYGDAALNGGGCVLCPATAPFVELDAASASVRAAASVSFAELLAAVVPHGWLLPVLPGTAGVTVGGAIAADVHGKNQRWDGSISAWVERIEMIDGTGTPRTLTATADPDAFRATVGGLGLTGVIVAATIRLIPIVSTSVHVTVRRLPDLDALLAALDASPSRYTVAWVDTTAPDRSLGRGVLDEADHLTEPQAGEADGLAFRQAPARRVPTLPFCPVTPLSARAFNSAWFAKAPRHASRVIGLSAQFHRLDAVAGYHRLAGPRGLVQYQFAVPDGAERVLAEVLAAVRRARCAPFLGTLKRFGPAAAGYLSFPLAGWSLAVDMPAGHPRLGPLLHGLDTRVAAAGGRVYLAKDSALQPGSLAAMYPTLPQWQTARAKLDPAGVFQSDLGRRLGLTAPATGDRC
jgi:decaprenylphospho-beta-D-ribofuranose 2-oxidase